MDILQSAADFEGIGSLASVVWQNPSPAFLEQLPIAIYACDASGRILWYNSRAAAMWGREPRIADDSELFCGSYKLYLDGRVIARQQMPMAAVLQTGIPVSGVEGRVERPDGSHIWTVADIEPIRGEDGDVLGAINCFHERAGGDRPEKVPSASSDDLVQARDERLAATYEHVGAGIVEIDQDGRMLRVNQQLCRLTGYAASELLGRTIFEETLPDDVAKDHAQFSRQLEGEFDSYIIEKRIYRKGGGYIWAAVTSSSVRDAAGKFLYAVRVQHDITDRKRAEEALAWRMKAQAALFAFSERLQHCRSADQIHDASLDAITRSLGCTRASILLYDTSDVMLFTAWRGLSQTYRDAVEGHSPWDRNETNPSPVCIEDVASSDLPESLKQTIIGEGIRSVLFIPIMQDDRLAGKFMAYHTAPYSFTEAELETALTLARLLGFSLTRRADEEARLLAERDAQQLAAIVESSSDAIVSKNLDGIIQTWNDGASRLFGYDKDEVVGKPISLLIPHDRQDEEPQILAKIRAGQLIEHFETIRRRKDGSLIDISLTISPIRDRSGRVIGASKIARDITERRLAEKRLQESEQRLQELLAAIPAAIYTTDAQGRITYFNQTAVEFAGRMPLLGSDAWCVTWKLFYPDGTPLPHEQCPMAVALKEGRVVRGVEAVAERPDGTRVPFIPFPTPLRDASGQVTGAINMLVDLSERKQAETQQRLLLNELNHRTKNNMQMLQSLLHAAARSARSEEARQVLNEACGRIAAMAAAQRVLYGTTDASRFSAEGFLGAVVETIQQLLPPGTRITQEGADGVLSNDIAMPLALILNELLTNAAKHGIKDQARDSIRVGLTKRDGEFELWVEDDGPGFDLDVVRNSSSGLRLVLGLARQLHGALAVTREPSRATLRFKATESD